MLEVGSRVSILLVFLECYVLRDTGYLSTFVWSCDFDAVMYISHHTLSTLSCVSLPSWLTDTKLSHTLHFLETFLSFPGIKKDQEVLDMVLPRKMVLLLWRKGVLGNVHTRDTHSHGSWDKSKDPCPLRNSIIPYLTTTGAPGTTRPQADWFLGPSSCLVVNYAVSQQVWVLAILSLRYLRYKGKPVLAQHWQNTLMYTMWGGRPVNRLILLPGFSQEEYL